jgi:hypothetical protein
LESVSRVVSTRNVVYSLEVNPCTLTECTCTHLRPRHDRKRDARRVVRRMIDRLLRHLRLCGLALQQSSSSQPSVAPQLQYLTWKERGEKKKPIPTGRPC